MVPLLDAARAARLRLGVASNSTHPHVEGHLGRLGLLARFEFLACREDVPSPKPEPDLYRLVLNHFGLKGSEAIAFEDSHTGVARGQAGRPLGGERAQRLDGAPRLLARARARDLARGRDLGQPDRAVLASRLAPAG